MIRAIRSRISVASSDVTFPPNGSIKSDCNAADHSQNHNEQPNNGHPPSGRHRKNAANPVSYQTESVAARELRMFYNRNKLCNSFKKVLSSSAGLLVVLLMYMALGATLFRAFEMAYEEKLTNDLNRKRDEVAKEILKCNEMDDSCIATHIKNWELQVSREYQPIFLTLKKNDRIWTWGNAFYFCFTTISTIGYGNITPLTTAGRLTCSIYAVLGIPLMLLFIADVGIALARWAKICAIAIKQKRQKTHAFKEAAKASLRRHLKSSKNSVRDVETMEEAMEADLDPPQITISLSTIQEGEENGDEFWKRMHLGVTKSDSKQSSGDEGRERPKFQVGPDSDEDEEEDAFTSDGSEDCLDSSGDSSYSYTESESKVGSIDTLKSSCVDSDSLYRERHDSSPKVQNNRWNRLRDRHLRNMYDIGVHASQKLADTNEKILKDGNVIQTCKLPSKEVLTLDDVLEENIRNLSQQSMQECVDDNNRNKFKSDESFSNDTPSTSAEGSRKSSQEGSHDSDEAKRRSSRVGFSDVIDLQSGKRTSLEGSMANSPVMSDPDQQNSCNGYTNNDSYPMQDGRLFKNPLADADDTPTANGFKFIQSPRRNAVFIPGCDTSPTSPPTSPDLGGRLNCDDSSSHRRSSISRRMGQAIGSFSSVSDREVAHFSFPAWLAMLLLFIYLLFGAGIFTYIHGWNYADSFYFSFVSLSTIGFGDMTPSGMATVVTFIYSFLGLCFTSMCMSLSSKELTRLLKTLAWKLGYYKSRQWKSSFRNFVKEKKRRIHERSENWRGSRKKEKRTKRKRSRMSKSEDEKSASPHEERACISTQM